MSLSSIPKLLTPKMLILSIFDIFALWKTDRSMGGEADDKNRQLQQFINTYGDSPGGGLIVWTGFYFNYVLFAEYKILEQICDQH